MIEEWRVRTPAREERKSHQSWQLWKDPVDYRFSSARFYETWEDEFNVLTHYMDKL